MNKPEIFGGRKCFFCNENEKKIYSFTKPLCSFKHFARKYWIQSLKLAVILIIPTIILFQKNQGGVYIFGIIVLALIVSIYGKLTDSFESKIELSRTNEDRNSSFNDFILNSN